MGLVDAAEGLSRDIILMIFEMNIRWSIFGGWTVLVLLGLLAVVALVAPACDGLLGSRV